LVVQIRNLGTISGKILVAAGRANLAPMSALSSAIQSRPLFAGTEELIA